MGLHIFLFRICAITSRQDGLQPDHLDATCRVVLAEKADLGGNALTEDVDMAYDAYFSAASLMKAGQSVDHSIEIVLAEGAEPLVYEQYIYRQPHAAY